MSTVEEDIRKRGPKVEYTAAANLAGFTAAAIVHGQAVTADKDTAAHAGRLRGIVAESISTGGTASILVYGPMIHGGWSWTPNLPIYLGSSGSLTQTPPLVGILQQIATADSATQIFVDIQEVADRSNLIAAPFSWGDASPVAIGSVPAGGRVTRIDLLITTPFNGLGAAITLGDSGDPDRLVTTEQNMPSQVATYEVHPGHLYASATPILLAITPGSGASSGAGTVLLHFQR